MRINTPARNTNAILIPTASREQRAKDRSIRDPDEREKGRKRQSSRPGEERQKILLRFLERETAMGRGVLEVHLVDAKGLSGSDFLGKIDPYVVVQYRSQERKSSTSRDQGRNPAWNEVFRFQINSSAANAQHKLFFRIMDHDNFSSDDFLGEASVNVTDLISIGMERGTSQLNTAKYSVVTADNSYHGEIRVGITFTASKVEEDGGAVGGWTNSYRE